jgi:hypothetical protein
MVRVDAVSLGACDLVDDCYGSVAEAVQLLRECWCEQEGRDWTYVVRSERGVEATMIRPEGDDPELCLTLWSDGRVELHRCHYILGADGQYERTHVAQLPFYSVAMPRGVYQSQPVPEDWRTPVPAGWASV